MFPQERWKRSVQAARAPMCPLDLRQWCGVDEDRAQTLRLAVPCVFVFFLEVPCVFVFFLEAFVRPFFLGVSTFEPPLEDLDLSWEDFGAYLDVNQRSCCVVGSRVCSIYQRRVIGVKLEQH